MTVIRSLCQACVPRSRETSRLLCFLLCTRAFILERQPCNCWPQLEREEGCLEVKRSEEANVSLILLFAPSSLHAFISKSHSFIIHFYAQGIYRDTILSPSCSHSRDRRDIKQNVLEMQGEMGAPQRSTEYLRSKKFRGGNRESCQWPNIDPNRMCLLLSPTRRGAVHGVKRALSLDLEQKFPECWNISLVSEHGMLWGLNIYLLNKWMI